MSPRRRRAAADGYVDRVAAAVTTAQADLAGVQDAIRTADAKAGLAISVQVAGLGALLAGAAGGHPALAGGWYRAAVVVLAAALALSGAVIFPRLARRQTRAERGGVYFGEHWTSEELAGHLLSQQPRQRLEALARQKVLCDRIARRKHALLRGSIAATAGAVVLLVAAVL